MMFDPSYRRRWAAKQEWHRENGVLPLEEGGGPAGTLLTTEDESGGGIDASALNEFMTQVFGWH